MKCPNRLMPDQDIDNRQSSSFLVRNGIPAGVDNIILDYIGIEFEDNVTHNEYVKEILSTDCKWLFPNIKRPSITKISKMNIIFKYGYLPILKRVIRDAHRKRWHHEHQGNFKTLLDIEQDKRFHVDKKSYKIAYKNKQFELIDWVEANLYVTLSNCELKLMLKNQDETRFIKHLSSITNIMGLLNHITSIARTQALCIQNNSKPTEHSKKNSDRLNFVVRMLKKVIIFTKYKSTYCRGWFEQCGKRLLYDLEQYDIIDKIEHKPTSNDIITLIKCNFIHSSDEDIEKDYGVRMRQLSLYKREIYRIKSHNQLGLAPNKLSRNEYTMNIVKYSFTNYFDQELTKEVILVVDKYDCKSSKVLMYTYDEPLVKEYKYTQDTWLPIFRSAILYKNNMVMKYCPRMLYRLKYVEAICANMNLEIVQLWVKKRPDIFKDICLLMTAIAYNTLDVIIYLMDIIKPTVNYRLDCMLTAKFRLKHNKNDQQSIEIAKQFRTDCISFDDSDCIVYYQHIHLLKSFTNNRLVLSDVKFITPETNTPFNVSETKNWYGYNIYEHQIKNKFVIDYDTDKIRFGYISSINPYNIADDSLNEFMENYYSNFYIKRTKLERHFIKF
jgi:hypothetical protein